MKEVLTEINDDVKDIIDLEFELTKTQNDYVPHFDDPGLTFERGKIKKAKLIETCVLYADIRNSSELSSIKSPEFMAKLYTAFVKSALVVAEYHGGVVRNIIGDRVMIVFPYNNCFTNAVETAVSINTVAKHIINNQFKGINFEVGIGIDYGKKKVIKAGIPKHDKERNTYRGLVWVGTSANIASKLTDIACKLIPKKVFNIRVNPKNPNYLQPKNGLADSIRKILDPHYIPVLDFHEHLTDKEVLITLDPDEYHGSFERMSNGVIYLKEGKILSITKTETHHKLPPILMSQKVWQEYDKENQNANDVTEKFWKVQDVKLKDYKGQIFGGNVIWSAIKQIKI